MVTMKSVQETQQKGSDPTSSVSISPPKGETNQRSPDIATRSWTSPRTSSTSAELEETKRETVIDKETVQTMEFSGNGTNSHSSPKTDHPTHTAHQIALNSASTNATLMQVYTSLTQSSTPQVPPLNTQETALQTGQTVQDETQLSSRFHIPPPMFHVPRDRGQETLSHLSNVNETSQIQYHIKEEVFQPDDAIPSSIRVEAADEQESNNMVANEESDEQSSHYSSRRKRRGSQELGAANTRGGGSSNGSVTKPKKKNKQDGRWSKRFTWPEDLHRDFVSAIFDVGLKQSSPSTILEHMPKHEQITTERIKSHLQKYRLHRAKSKKEFITSYEASLRKFQNQGGAGAASTIAGGEVAAHLTFSNQENVADDVKGITGTGGDDSVAPWLSSDNVNSKVGAVLEENPDSAVAPMSQSPHEQQNESLMLPELTELEKQSPIGAAMGYLMGLFFSLRQQLLIQRSLEASPEGAEATVPVQDVYSSFTGGSSALVSAVAIGPEHPPEGILHQQTIPSMRTNIEENSIMKREMQNQMVLQNKMRALKEQELAKYKIIDTSHDDSRKSTSLFADGGGGNDLYTAKNQSGLVTSNQGVSHGQGTGELASHDPSDNAHHRPHGVSFGNPADLWNADVVDEQLFEFLMND
jgi:SHAQKYF class myb-like DNA-binding protein